MHKRLDEFEFRPPLSTGIATREQLCFHIFSVAFGPILFKLKSNENMHIILDEFK